MCIVKSKRWFIMPYNLINVIWNWKAILFVCPADGFEQTPHLCYCVPEQDTWMPCHAGGGQKGGWCWCSSLTSIRLPQRSCAYNRVACHQCVNVCMNENNWFLCKASLSVLLKRYITLMRFHFIKCIPLTKAFSFSLLVQQRTPSPSQWQNVNTSHVPFSLTISKTRLSLSVDQSEAHRKHYNEYSAKIQVYFQRRITCSYGNRASVLTERLNWYPNHFWSADKPAISTFILSLQDMQVSFKSQKLSVGFCLILKDSF